MAAAYQSTTGGNVNSGTSFSINKPASTALNDLLIMQIYSGVTINAPSGWTALISPFGDGSGSSGGIFYKLATASEPSSYTITLTSSSEACGAIHRVTGQDATTPTVASNSNTSAASPTPNNTGVTPGVANTLLMQLINWNNNVRTLNSVNVANSNPSWTLVTPAASSVSLALGIAYGSFTPATATGTATGTLSGSAGWGSALIAIQSALPVTVAVSSMVATSTMPAVVATVRVAVSAMVATFTMNSVTVRLGAAVRGIAKSVSSWINLTKT